MTDALKQVAGAGMKRLLAKLTTNRFSAVFAGATVTAIIQSSSVTTVLVVGFVSAGLMSLTQSIGVIMGANIGTTITAQIIAFKVTKYALILVAMGFAMLFASKRERIKQYGTMLMGLGLIFFGMDLMGSATSPLQSYEPFLDAMQQMSNPLLAILVSAAFTGLVQSSSATTGIIIVLASQGLITLEAGIALAFGANVGTCVTATLAALGKPREAVQAAEVHIIFNVVGVLIWLAFIDPLADLIRTISPVASDLSGVAKLAAETPRQVANAHSLFNVINTLLFIGFVSPMGWLVQRLVPVRKEAATKGVQPRYLDEILLETPSLALDRVRMELRRLGERAHHMVEQALKTAAKGTKEDLEALARLDDEVDALHEALAMYLGKLSSQTLTTEQARQVHKYIAAANNIESIGDMIETNIVRVGLDRLRTNLAFSPATQAALEALHAKVTWAVQLSLESLDASSPDMAQQVIDAKADLSRLASEADRHLEERLAHNGVDRFALIRIETEIIEYLRRVYYFAKRIAKDVADV